VEVPLASLLLSLALVALGVELIISGHGQLSILTVFMRGCGGTGHDEQLRMKHKRRVVWSLVGLSAALVIFIALFFATVPFSSKTLRHRIVATLSARLNSDVELGDLDLRVFPRLRAHGSKLIIRERGRNDLPPLISIDAFHVDADLHGLIRKRVAHVQLDGLNIQIPPNDRDDDDRDKAEGGHEKAEGGPRASKSEPTSIEKGVVIERLNADNAKLVILRRKKDRPPKVWDIHTLTMRNVGADQAMPYDATLTNAVPPGEIKTSGSFGPWRTDDEGATPLKGSFTFDRADLSVFEGISGILRSKGTFDGSLARIDVKGETDTPDFTIKVGGHPFALHTKYHSIVDGTNGDTRLERIDASFLNSSLVAKGSVVDEPGHVKGRPVYLDVQMDQARIEDVMRMAVPTPKPPMVGALKLTTKFFLPPGKGDVSERLELDGRFTIAQARFANYDVQGKIMELSHRGRGQNPEAAKQEVTSNFAGRFKLGNGVIALPEVTFDVPGAKVQLAGQYALKQETIDFKGELLLDAKISETTTGVKSLLLKAVDPLFNREGGGSSIPIKIEGQRKEPKFGLDARRVFKKGD